MRCEVIRSTTFFFFLGDMLSKTWCQVNPSLHTWLRYWAWGYKPIARLLCAIYINAGQFAVVDIRHMCTQYLRVQALLSVLRLRVCVPYFVVWWPVGPHCPGALEASLWGRSLTVTESLQRLAPLTSRAPKQKGQKPDKRSWLTMCTVTDRHL